MGPELLSHVGGRVSCGREEACRSCSPSERRNHFKDPGEFEERWSCSLASIPMTSSVVGSSGVRKAARSLSTWARGLGGSVEIELASKAANCRAKDVVCPALMNDVSGTR